MKLHVCFLYAIGLAALASARPQGGGDGGSEVYGGYNNGGDEHQIIHPHHGKSHQSFWMKNEHGEMIHVDGGQGGEDSHAAHPHHAKSHQKVWLKNEHEKKIEIKAHPHYHYGYDVHDSHTHDVKNQYETRDGHMVKGEYSVLEPDHKHLRIVQYTSDKKQGWVAKVIRKKLY